MQQEGIEGAGGLQEESALETVEAAPEVAPEAPAESQEGAKEPEGPKDESVRETVARALEEERKKLAGDEGPAKPEAQQKPSKDGAPKHATAKPAKDAVAFDGKPPQRLSAAQKEAFNALPPQLKAGVASMFAEHERTFTAAMQEARRAEAESRGIIEAVNPFATSWAERGFTVPAAVAALAAANEKLLNEKTRESTFLNLGNDLQVDWERMAALARGEEKPAASVASHPEITALREELNALKSEREQVRSKQLNESVQGIVSEMAAVRDEQDQFGRYLYPEMHEEGFFERAKPLVSALRATIPGLSYGEALKRAYSSITGRPAGNSAQQSPARFPSQENQQQTRALSAAVSVRGRTAPQVTGMAMPDRIPDSVRETTRMALEQLRRGT